MGCQGATNEVSQPHHIKGCAQLQLHRVFFNLGRERGDTPWAETTHLRMVHDDDPAISTHALISLIRNVTQLES